MLTMQGTVSVTVPGYDVTVPVTARTTALSIKEFTEKVLKPIADFINTMKNMH